MLRERENNCDKSLKRGRSDIPSRVEFEYVNERKEIAMSTLMTAMKDEIRRVARKEIRAATSGLKKDRAAFRKAIAFLRRQSAEHDKSVRQLLKAAAKQAKVQPALPEAAGAGKARITAKGVRALRKKLKLSQTAFGKLVGVNGQSVWKWEKRSGPLVLRTKTRQAFLAIRGLGVREARQRLGQ